LSPTLEESAKPLNVDLNEKRPRRLCPLGPVRVLNGFYSAVSTLEVEAVLPYFHEPSLLIGSQGVFAATTHTLLATALTPAMEGFRARGFWSNRAEPTKSKVVECDRGIGFRRCTAV
jgi:hypothetical protein